MVSSSCVRIGAPYLHGMTAADGKEADEQPGQGDLCCHESPSTNVAERYQGPPS
jgi:hypothetical protein